MEGLNTWLIGLLIAAAVTGVSGLLWRIIQKQKATASAPNVVEFFEALTPWLYKAVLAGEKALIWSLDEADQKIEGADKKAVADSTYALLPDSLLIGGRPIPIGLVKTVVTEDLWESWIKGAYDQAHAFILKNESYLRGQVDALNPGPPPSQG